MYHPILLASSFFSEISYSFRRCSWNIGKTFLCGIFNQSQIHFTCLETDSELYYLNNCCKIFGLFFLICIVSSLSGILGVKTQNITNNTILTCIQGAYDNGTFLHGRLKEKSQDKKNGKKNNFKIIILYHWQLTLLFPQKFHLFLPQYWYHFFLSDDKY